MQHYVEVGGEERGLEGSLFAPFVAFKSTMFCEVKIYST